MGKGTPTLTKRLIQRHAASLLGPESVTPVLQQGGFWGRGGT